MQLLIWLSTYIQTPWQGRDTISAKKCQRNLASCLAVANTTYSASQGDYATTIIDCFLLFHGISELSSVTFVLPLAETTPQALLLPSANSITITFAMFYYLNLGGIWNFPFRRPLWC